MILSLSSYFCCYLMKFIKKMKCRWEKIRRIRSLSDWWWRYFIRQSIMRLMYKRPKNIIYLSSHSKTTNEKLRELLESKAVRKTKSLICADSKDHLISLFRRWLLNNEQSLSTWDSLYISRLSEQFHLQKWKYFFFQLQRRNW